MEIRKKQYLVMPMDFHLATLMERVMDFHWVKQRPMDFVKEMQMGFQKVKRMLMEIEMVRHSGRPKGLPKR